MIEKIIDYSARNQFVVYLLVIFAVVAGVWAIRTVPLDAIPDLTDTQVIVFSEWMGRSPNLVEDQVTYPLVSAMLSAPRVKAVRGQSMFGMSFVYVIFEDGTDIYWARSRVLEYLSQLQGKLPPGVTPQLGPDATGVGWVYEYALVDESGKHDLAELRAFQDWHLRYWLASVPGVAEVASVGGFEKQYQVDLDPDRLLAFNLPVSRVVGAIRAGNLDVGGRSIEMSGKEYVVRGRGYITSTRQLEQVAVGRRADGTPLLLGEVANVHLGPEMRRGLTELDGKGEVVGGIVVMRYGENARNVISRVKARIDQVTPSLPKGVKIVTTYDRSDLINRSIATLRRTLIEEGIIVSLVIIIFLLHVPSALRAIITLPIAVLLAFIPMRLMGITANIMSLGGIAIAVGAMVDEAVVMIENVHKKLEHAPPGADRKELTIEACKEIGRPLFFSLMVIMVSFLPVFTLEAQEGRLFKPLAYTKTFSMLMAAALSITLAPALMVLLSRGKIIPESRHPVSRTLQRFYQPWMEALMRRRLLSISIAVIAVLSCIPLLTVKRYSQHLGWQFMPPLNERDMLYMPQTVPGISITEAGALLQVQDRLIKEVPEVARVFGKAGRAQSATDPAPLDMMETTILLKSEDKWRKVPARRWYSGRAPEWLKRGLRRIWPERRTMTWEELKDDLDARLQLPGVSNAWTMPIKARIDMLTTGIRTPVGIKILGPDPKVIERIGGEIEAALKQVPGTRSAYAERTTVGYYVDIIPRREQAARYGLSVQDVQDIVETAIGGTPISTTIEGRERFTINVRYARELRGDLDKLSRVMVPIAAAGGGAETSPQGAAMPGAGTGGGAGSGAGAGGSSMGGMGGGAALPGAMSAAAGGGGSGTGTPPQWRRGYGAPRIAAAAPLGQIADIVVSTGPNMIKDENGSLTGWVYVGVAGRDIGGYVEDAKKAVAAKVQWPSGYYPQWTGEYELMERVKKRLALVVPITLLIIIVMLYLNSHSVAATAIVLLSVPFALTGSVWMLYLHNIMRPQDPWNLSIAVMVGMIALAGLAAETGVVMLVYLEQAYHRFKAEGKMNTQHDLFHAITYGAVQRIRPKLMTVMCILMGLVPLMWAHGAGADVMRRIAAPMIGGVITSSILTLEIVPAIYSLWRGRSVKWVKEQPGQPRPGAASQ